MLTDLTPSELRGYAPDVAEPADFDEFWSGQLAAARAAARAPVFTAADAGIRHAEVFDVTFSGFGGDPGGGELTRPELVEVGRLGHVGDVAEQFGKRKVGEHGPSPCGRWRAGYKTIRRGTTVR